MQKLFMKKEERIEKNGQVSEWLKQWVLWCPPEKREKEKRMTYVFLQSWFQVSIERDVFKEHSRIRIATIYFHHSTHMHILIWLYDLTLFGSKVWLYNICIVSMLFHALINSHELYISLSAGRRHNIILCLGEDPQIPHIWETWECHARNL
jgi:hypothetical protein